MNETRLKQNEIGKKFESRSFRSEQRKSGQNSTRLKWNQAKGKMNKIGKNLSLTHAWAEVLKPAQTLFVVDDLDEEKKPSPVPDFYCLS
jgi:hypothetical protein